MPMAVTIESIENTMSMRMICTMIAENAALAVAARLSSCGSSISACISCVAL
ncbi:hypothetical protein D3C83_298520 [compost metagenome]